MKSKHALSLEIASRVLIAVDAGLVSGMGKQIPGQMCVEAAVCFAFGLPHGDEPPCVGSAVRSFKIALNDSSWSSNQARAAGMRRLAIAQLGSDTLDQSELSQLLALRATQRLLPDALRDYAQYCYPEYIDKLKTIADECEKVQNKKDVDARLDRLDSLASLARLDRLARLASLDSLASLARLDRLARLARLDSLASLARLDRLARLASLARLDRLDSLASLARLDRLDKFLMSVAVLGEQVLVEMKSPGCEWLHLCDDKKGAS